MRSEELKREDVVIFDNKIDLESSIKSNTSYTDLESNFVVK
jgi:hypothetical protein